MRWVVFVVFAFVFFAAEVSLRNALVLRGVGSVSPSFVAVLAVFIALFAPRAHVLWACWILGLLMDLLTPLMHGSDTPDPLLGAYALGYVFGGVLLLQIRAMLFRQRALTFTVMTVLFLLAANIVIVAIYAVHTWYPDEALHWAQLRPAWELLRRLGNALYAGLLALLLGPVLIWTTPLWAFRAGPQQRAGWR